MAIINPITFRTESGVHQNPGATSSLNTHCLIGLTSHKKTYVDVYIYWSGTAWIESPIWDSNLPAIRVALKVNNVCTGAFSYVDLDGNDFRNIQSCCPSELLITLQMKNNLGANVDTYPVGVFNMLGDFIGVANNQGEYVTLWNSNVTNQTQGELFPGPTISTFKIVATATITEVKGLKYYTFTSFNNTIIFTGDNDIVVYGATVKKGNVDGVSTNTDTLREWNRNLFPGAVDKTKIPTDTVRVLTCTGYTTGQTLYVFHNDDSKYAGVRHSIGYVTIGGRLPIGLLAFYSIGQQTTNFNLVTNWPELTSLFDITINHGGGSPWFFNNPAYFPNANLSQLKTVHIAQCDPTVFATMAAAFTATSLPILDSFVFNYNTDVLRAGDEAWFLTMPKVKQYFRFHSQTATAVASSVADAIWNNIATALNGIVPTGVKEIAIKQTGSVTAASLTARNYLISQGWTLNLTT